MSASALSPAEQAEVDRFGMHDEDVLDLHDESDEPLCGRGDAPAVASLVLRCCGASYLVCAHHLRRSRITMAASGPRKCKTCGHIHPGGDFDAAYRVVPL